MRSSKLKINYESLRPMDIVLTTSDSWIAKVIRWVTAGFLAKPGTVATHCGLVVRRQDTGLLEIAEMIADNNFKFPINLIGARAFISPFSNYDGNHDGNIIQIMRSSVYDDISVREAANNHVLQSVAKGILYDYAELFQFIGGPEGNKNKLVCSEFVVFCTVDDIPWPANFTKLVSPYDIQRSPLLTTLPLIMIVF